MHPPSCTQPHQLLLRISLVRNIYTAGIGRRYTLGLFFLRELIKRHVSHMLCDAWQLEISQLNYITVVLDYTAECISQHLLEKQIQDTQKYKS